MSRGHWIEPGSLFADSSMDFAARGALGATATGTGDVGDVMAALDAVVDEQPQSWFAAWTSAGDRHRDEAQIARDRGHHRTSGWHYLAAASCFHHALNVIDSLPDTSALLPTFRRHRECWDGVVAQSEGRFVPVAVPYGGNTLPGYLLRPDASGAARPTLVMTNGSDGSLPSLLGHGASEALARGWNAFIYDGPGQQSMLFEHGVPFRFDWEAVLTPVIDTLVGRPDVDASALTGYGVSQAGYWLPRALAFEHRLVAAVVDPGVLDVSTSWTAHLPKEMLDLLHGGQKATFNEILAQIVSDPALERTFAFRSRPYGLSDAFDVFTEVGKYHLRDVAANIRTPLLITDPEDEQFWPGQAVQLHALLPDIAQLLGFGRQEGANGHCQPMGRRLTELRMFDWLQERLDHR